MNEIQTMKKRKQQYIHPVISVVEIGSTLLLSASDGVKIRPEGHGDASKAMIGTYNSPWGIADEEDEGW